MSTIGYGDCKIEADYEEMEWDDEIAHYQRHPEKEQEIINELRVNYGAKYKGQRASVTAVELSELLPNHEIQVLPEGTLLSREPRANRIRIFYDKEGNVKYITNS